MAQVVAITDAVKTLAEVEQRFSLTQRNEPDFFLEWQQDLPTLTPVQQAGLDVMHRRLRYHRAVGDLLEGAVTLLVASPLLDIAGFYDPPFRLKAEAAVEIAVDDGEEILRGRIDILILQQQLWVLVLEAKKTTISLRSALPQAIAYMMANITPERPLFGMLTNGDELVFIKLIAEPKAEYSLSRAFSLYTLPSELTVAMQVLTHMGQQMISTGS
ncbi:MAG: type I restriction endonuclease [Cyanobacteria bacterium P01_A01_bin.123]